MYRIIGPLPLYRYGQFAGRRDSACKYFSHRSASLLPRIPRHKDTFHVVLPVHTVYASTRIQHHNSVFIYLSHLHYEHFLIRKQCERTGEALTFGIAVEAGTYYYIV